MEQFTMEKVTSIPASSWTKVRRGESKYSEIFTRIKEMPIKQPMKIQHPSFKANRLYNSLWRLFKKKRMSNIRLALRKGVLYAEKLYE